MTHLRFGADVLADNPGLLGYADRVALVTNDAARCAHDAELRTRVELLAAGIPIVRLFSPEHGLAARAADGAAVRDGADPLTGLPVVSLYGERFAPPAEALRDVSAVLFDIPDVGARFYTYLWTLTHAIDACAAADVPLIVLDRPNPLGGELESVEGPLLEDALVSFVGRHAIPIRHSLTLGELALLWRSERCPNADVQVIPCEGWLRDELWSSTRMPFVPTSPAITRFEAALFYPGLCLFEATNLSVARGARYSFEAIGAPWLDAQALTQRFTRRSMRGVNLETVQFKPSAGPYAGESCNGVRLVARNPRMVRPVRIGLALLADTIALHGDEFAFRTYPTAANPAGEDHFERLIGRGDVRERITNGPVGDALLDEWTSAPGWAERWDAVRIYDSGNHVGGGGV